jgi:hypothetical protein
MRMKFERKKPKDDEIWTKKKLYKRFQTKIIAIKRMMTNFERLKIHKGWN